MLSIHHGILSKYIVLSIALWLLQFSNGLSNVVSWHRGLAVQILRSIKPFSFDV